MDSRVVIVTGASSGIGEATAKAFGARGDRVVLVARREDRLRQLAAALPQSLPLPGDLANTDEAFRIVEAVVARYGQVDVLVNNAGRSEEHTSELQSRPHLVCRLLLEKKKKKHQKYRSNVLND